MRRHVHELRVRYHECDAQGHLFNAHYLAYFDMAVTELWRDVLGSYQALLDRGLDVVVAEAGVRYHAPARFDDVVAVAVQVAELGTTSMTTGYAVSRDGTQLATGRLRHVFVDPQAMTKTPIPEDIRALLQAPSR